MISYYVICYVTVVMYFFIINKRKRNIKSRKMNKRKKKKVGVQAHYNMDKKIILKDFGRLQSIIEEQESTEKRV